MTSLKVKRLTIAAVIIFLISIASFACSYFLKIHKAEDDYNSLLISTTENIYQYKLIAEVHCKNIEKVWYNSIYQISAQEYNEYVISNDGNFNDFNTAIINYYKKNVSSIVDLEKGKNLIEDGMKLLRIIREKYNFDDNTYNSLIELYNSFAKIADMAISPEGTYNKYSSDLSQYMNEFKDQYRKVKILLPNNQFNILGTD